ncbi:MAG: hypothetical protein QOJ94_877 [Sphingomonadales bacterium]|jgi:hypothetical protein|nr:hypothetical protein [Sphingomonadales bacterium]
MRDVAETEGDAFERFEAALLDDPALQLALARHERTDDFAAEAADLAAGLGLTLSADAIEARMRPGLPGVGRLFPPPKVHARPPRGDWLPVALAPLGEGDALIDWACFAGAELTDPFFAMSAMRATSRPYNRLLPYATRLGALLDEPGPVREPDGLIFHQSRCGSTLVARMLGALPRSTSISEAPPIDAILQLGPAAAWSEAQRAAALRVMIGAYGRRAERRGGPFFVKLDSWHTLALPLFRAAFPNVPWVFLYRDPVEILVSQMRQRGPQTVPQLIPPAFYGLASASDAPGEAYCAQVLERIASAALDHREGGLAVDYSELPTAVKARILPHFGVASHPVDESALAAAAERDAKDPNRAFRADAAEKREGASDAVRAAAAEHLASVHAALEAWRRSA